MLGGSFEDAIGRTVTWNVVEVHDYNGEVFTGGDMDDVLHEADRVFYELDVEDGETFFRWVAGPFETEGDLESAIADEADFYSEAV